MNAKSKNRVLAAGKYSKGQFEVKTLGGDGKVKTIKYERSVDATNESPKETEKTSKEILTAYNIRKPKLPVQKSIDVPEFMKKRSQRMQRERLRKDMGFLGSLIHSFNQHHTF